MEKIKNTALKKNKLSTLQFHELILVWESIQNMKCIKRHNMIMDQFNREKIIHYDFDRRESQFLLDKDKNMQK